MYVLCVCEHIHPHACFLYSHNSSEKCHYPHFINGKTEDHRETCKKTKSQHVVKARSTQVYGASNLLPFLPIEAEYISVS